MSSRSISPKHAFESESSAGSRKNAMHWILSLAVIAFVAAGIYQAMHSSLFALTEVRVEPISANYPLTREKILELAKISVGKHSLFDLPLAPVETRLMRNPWVKGVIVGKQFPNTLSLKIIERKPVALLTENNGRVLYLESDGATFEDQAMVYPHDLPILVGFFTEKVEVLKKINTFIQTWFSSVELPEVKLSAIHYDEKQGLQAMISYPMKNQKQMRSVLEMGLNVEEATLVPKKHLLQVLSYLSARSMSASKIWLGDGKKIVVKVSRGS